MLEPLIPQRVNTHRFGGGRPRVPYRTCANGIFYVLCTGCQWKALDATDIEPVIAKDYIPPWGRGDLANISLLFPGQSHAGGSH